MRPWKLALALVLLFPAAALAQHPPLVPVREHHCPPNQYPRLHWWLPEWYRAKAFCHGPQDALYAPDRYPQVPTTFLFEKYKCPAVPSTEFYSRRYLNY